MVFAVLPAIAVCLAIGVGCYTPVGASVPAEEAGPVVDVRVTQRYLEPLCLNGARVRLGERRWRLALRAHSLTFTMRNEPRPGGPGPKGTPGFAVVQFTPEAGHKYEVEIRAPESAYGSRVWEKGDWKPVIRDRTVERIVSGEPEWRESACQP